MAKIVSCGVVILNARRELFVCHTTGTSRWDLPKGVLAGVNYLDRRIDSSDLLPELTCCLT